MYLIVALVIYCYAGTAVASPALGSTSPLIRKIAYGIATPTITYVSLYIPSHTLLPPLSFSLNQNNTPLTPTLPLSQNLRRHLRPSRLQMHLRPPLPRHRPHGREYLALLRRMGPHRNDALVLSVGYRGGGACF